MKTKTKQKLKVPSYAVKIEMEHTKSKKKAKKIATDHIKELGKAYYPALVKMEAKLKKKRGKK